MTQETEAPDGTPIICFKCRKPVAQCECLAPSRGPDALRADPFPGPRRARYFAPLVPGEELQTFCDRMEQSSGQILSITLPHPSFYCVAVRFLRHDRDPMTPGEKDLTELLERAKSSIIRP